MKRYALPAIAAALLLPAACGDSVGPSGPLRIDLVTPSAFHAGDTLEIRGARVEDAVFTLDGIQLERISTARGVVRVRAPWDLPPCAAEPHALVLAAAFEAERDSVTVSTFGAPVTVALAPGEHEISAAASHGCRFRLAHAGVYGVTLFRVAVRNHTSQADRTQRKPIQVRLLPGQAGAAPILPALTVAGDVPRPTPPAPAMSAAGAAPEQRCMRPPLSHGDTLTLVHASGSGYVPFVTASASAHYAVVTNAAEFDGQPAARKQLLAQLADELEARVHPFLEQVFEEWPDIDGNGQLIIYMRPGIGAASSSGSHYYPDDCVGDFIELGLERLDYGFAATNNNPIETVVHEATHWYDLGYAADRRRGMPDWSLEGVAMFVQQLWRWQEQGIDFWGNHGHVNCPPGATCERILLHQDRYGWPGLSHEGGYYHGVHIVHYLVEQAIAHGASPLAAAGLLRNRRTGGEPLQLRPVFEAAGGSGRSEEELQGEYLLSFYADDNLSGISRRLTRSSWNLPANSPRYPLRHFVLDPANPLGNVELAQPDGITFEVSAPAGGVVALSAALDGLALGFVRAN
jgi:hypothetical protein